MAVDLKYGRVQTEFGDIGEDEPVFIFRAQDKLLLDVIGDYRSDCVAAGSPQHHLDAIDESARRIREWQSENYTRVPNSDKYAQRIAE